jgi:hypothetical protein
MERLGEYARIPDLRSSFIFPLKSFILNLGLPGACTFPKTGPAFGFAMLAPQPTRSRRLQPLPGALPVILDREEARRCLRN